MHAPPELRPQPMLASSSRRGYPTPEITRLRAKYPQLTAAVQASNESRIEPMELVVLAKVVIDNASRLDELQRRSSRTLLVAGMGGICL